LGILVVVADVVIFFAADAAEHFGRRHGHMLAYACRLSACRRAFETPPHCAEFASICDDPTIATPQNQSPPRSLYVHGLADSPSTVEHCSFTTGPGFAAVH
jgi:hypothetical protein